MRLKLTAQQWDFVKSLGIEDREYTQNEIDDVVIEALADKLMRFGFADGQENTNETGDLCEEIIDAIVDQR